MAELRATEVIEELQRLVNEYGDARLEIPDAIEGAWRNPVHRLEFDSERQSILVVCDD